MRVGSSGNYLIDPHTLQYYKTEYFVPDDQPVCARRVGKPGMKDANDLARERARKILASIAPSRSIPNCWLSWIESSRLPIRPPPKASSRMPGAAPADRKNTALMALWWTPSPAAERSRGGLLMDMLERLKQVVITGDWQTSPDLTRQALSVGHQARAILNTLVSGMDVVSEQWRVGDMYIPTSSWPQRQCTLEWMCSGLIFRRRIPG